MPALKTKRPAIAESPQLIPVEDLSAGLELRLSASLLKPDQARLLRNWSLEEPGALVTYPGWESFSTTSLGARRIQGGARIYLDGVTPFTLASDDGKVYKPGDDGVWGAAVVTGLSTTTQHYFPHDRDLAAVFDSTTIPQKTTDGTTWTGMGIAAPTVAPTTATVAGGSLIDTHTYEVSYAYQDDELLHVGNESATAQQAIAAPDLTLRVGVTASADPQVDKIVVYIRNVTAGETVRRKYAEYANTTTTRDLDGSVDWTQGEPAATDHNRPIATLSHAVIWKNRWWAPDGAVSNRLYFTQLFQPQSWPTLFYIDIPFERGDGIAAVVAQGDTLMVFGTSGKGFVIIGQTSLDFEVRPALGVQAGAFGPRSVAIIENGIVHVAAEGVYIYDGGSDRLLSYNIDPGWRDLVVRSTATDLAKIPVVYHALRKELRIGVPRLYPYGTAGEWVLDLNRTRSQETPAWTSTDRTIGGYIHLDGTETTTGNRGRLLSWSNTIAKLFEESVGTSADGSDLVCDYEGSTHATGGYVAQFTEGYVEYQPSTGTLSVEPFVDNAGKGSQNITINDSLAIVGNFVIGSQVIGGAGRLSKSFDLPMAAEGRTCALRFRYSGSARFRLYTYKLALVPEAHLSSI